MIEFHEGIIRKTIECYGTEKQSVVCMEECCELVQAISKELRGKSDKEHLAEEMADVLICMKMLKIMYHVTDDELNEWIKKKQFRQLKRITESGVGTGGQMMRRLVDVTDLEKFIQENVCAIGDDHLLLVAGDDGRWHEALPLVKTAYDVDKVVAELRRMSGNGYRDVDGDYVPPMIETKNAIEIVKKGIRKDISE